MIEQNNDLKKERLNTGFYLRIYGKPCNVEAKKGSFKKAVLIRNVKILTNSNLTLATWNTLIK